MLQGSFEKFGRKFGQELGLAVSPATGQREALQYLMLARLGMLFVVLPVLMAQQLLQRGPVSESTLVLGYGLISLAFAFNLLHAIFLKRFPAQEWVALSHLVFDCALVSAWILFSGARESLFALLYLIQILAVSLTFFGRGALSSSILAVAGFGLVNLVGGQPNAFVNWAAYSALFLTVGMVGGYLSDELLRTSQSLKEKSRRIEKLMALHERIISDLPSGLLTVDSELRINFVNPAAAHILGRRPEEIVGKALAEVEKDLLPFFSSIEAQTLEGEGGDPGAEAVSATGPQSHRSYFVQARSEKGNARLQQLVEIGRGLKARLLRGDVAELDVDAGRGGLLDEGATEGRVLLFQDVTKLVHLEEKLKQHEKLAAVGQLAAGIAHEIRNPLASMSASIEMLKDTMPVVPGQAENQKLMDIAIREIDRLNRLISEFLDFVKPEKFRFEGVDLKALLGELALALRQTKDFAARIELVESLAPETFALANGEKLKQVALNLLVNAAQATKGNGKVEVGCSSVDDHRVVFWVEDQGQGMSDEVLTHLYEPFFTTKDKGTGLGLATAYKIVEAHHGEIRVTSQVGVGTRFEVYLQKR